MITFVLKQAGLISDNSYGDIGMAKSKGIAEVRAGTVDRGTVRVLYIVQPDGEGHWGIDIELDRPMDPPCISLSC